MNEELVVVSTTQSLVVEPATGSVRIVNTQSYIRVYKIQ